MNEYLSRHSGLNEIVLGVTNLRIEVEQRPYFHRSSEPNIIHVETEWSALAECVCIGPGQLKCLPHDKATKNFVKSVSVLRLTNDEILEFSILKPH